MERTTFVLFFACALLVVIFFGLLELSFYLRQQQNAPLSQPPAHGTACVVEADFSSMPGGTNMTLLEKALEKRFSHMGVRAYLEPVSASQLKIMLPVAATDANESVGDEITRRGFLEFRVVNDNSEQIINNNEPIPPGYEVMPSLQKPSVGQPAERLVVRQQAEDGLAGDFVQNARVVPDNLGNPQIEFMLTKDAADRFAKVTTEYAPDKTTGTYHRLAIIVDDELYSAPRIAEPIVDGMCEISGNFTEPEAYHLAQVLNSPLPVPLKIVETHSF